MYSNKVCVWGGVEHVVPRADTGLLDFFLL